MKVSKKFNPDNVGKVAKILKKHDCKLPIECMIDLSYLVNDIKNENQIL